MLAMLNVTNLSRGKHAMAENEVAAGRIDVQALLGMDHLIELQKEPMRQLEVAVQGRPALPGKVLP